METIAYMTHDHLSDQKKLIQKQRKIDSCSLYLL